MELALGFALALALAHRAPLAAGLELELNLSRPLGALVLIEIERRRLLGRAGGRRLSWGGGGGAARLIQGRPAPSLAPAGGRDKCLGRRLDDSAARRPKYETHRAGGSHSNDNNSYLSPAAHLGRWRSRRNFTPTFIARPDLARAGQRAPRLEIGAARRELARFQSGRTEMTPRRGRRARPIGSSFFAPISRPLERLSFPGHTEPPPFIWAGRATALMSTGGEQAGPGRKC